MEPLVTAYRVDRCLTITLNRPQKMNCIDREMLQLLDQQITDAEMDRQVNVIVIRGAGQRAFSSGGDLKGFTALDEVQVVDWIRHGNDVFNRVENVLKPTVAVIQGYAYGGGLELALACDFRIAASDATFCNPELRHGWIPGWGGMARLRRLVGEAKAKELVFLGDVIDAATAHHIGLVSRLVDDGDLEATLQKMVNTLSDAPSEALAFAKAALMDPSRQTFGTDLMLDMLSNRWSKLSAQQTPTREKAKSRSES
jgi:enoyl-CoA hydratase/carnithine racemase